MNFLSRSTRKELQMRKKQPASPIAMPLMTACVMARVEHIPRSCRETGLSAHSPLLNSSHLVLVAIFPLNAELALLFELFDRFHGGIDADQHGSRGDSRPGDCVHFIWSGFVFLDRGLAHGQRPAGVAPLPKFEEGLNISDLSAQAGCLFLLQDKQAVDFGQLRV